MIVALRKNKIKQKLALRNKSQNWFAKRLGICSGYMSQLMCGQRNPSPGLRERIMNLFPECNHDDLFVMKRFKK
jgi:transcriptional regulator with XRE-family HTH domain